MAAGLPGDFVARPREFDQLVALLTEQGWAQVALNGAGGFGKTTLALALCHDPRIQQAFSDGILWVTLGKTPGNLTGRVLDLVEALSERRPGFTDLEAATAELAEQLGERRLLIVIDDVWNQAHLKPFLQGGGRCARLMTTRSLDTLPPHTRCVRVEAMQRAEAATLLAAGLDQSCEAAGEGLLGLADRLGRWPLLLRLVNGTLRRRVEAGESLAGALLFVEEDLRENGLTTFDENDEADRHRAVHLTLSLSLETLSPEERSRFPELAVFPEDRDIPLDTVQSLWSRVNDCSRIKTEKLCTRFFSQSLLLDLNLKTRTLRLHDVIGQYLADRQKENLAALHRQLLDAHRPPSQAWPDLSADEPYLWEHLTWHLCEAGLTAELHNLLAAETAAGRNAWYEAVVRANKLPGYFTDLSRAWQVAGAQSRADILAGRPASAIGLEIRYGLSRAAVSTLTTGLPLHVLKEAARRSLLTPAQLLAHVKSLPQEHTRQRYLKVETCLALAAFCGEAQQDALLHPGLDVVRETEEEEERAQHLFTLARQLPEPLLAEALRLTESLPDKLKEQVLSGIAGRMAELGQTAEAIALVQNLSDEEPRARAIHLMSRFLPREALTQALGLAQSLAEKSDARDKALAGLIPRFAQLGETDQALNLAAALSAARLQAQALVEAAPRLEGDALEQALSLAGRISEFEERMKASGRLAQQLPEPRRTETLEQLFDEAGQNWSRAGEAARQALIPRLPQSLLLKHLMSFSLRDEFRSQALTRLGELGCVNEALTEIGYLKSYEQVKCLEAIAPFLTESELPEVRRMIAALADQNQREIALSCVLPRAAEFGNAQEALAEADSFVNPYLRDKAVEGIVPQLDAAGLRALIGRFQRIDDVAAQREALLLLAAESPLAFFSEITDALSAGVSRAVQEHALVRISSHLSPTQPQLLGVIPLFIEDEQNRAQAWLTLVPVLDPARREEAIRAVLDADRDAGEIFRLTKTLVRLLPELNEPFRSEVRRLALDSARKRLSPGSADLVAPLLADLGEPQEALSAVRSLGEGRSGISALARLAGHLPEAEQQEVIAELLAAISRETNPYRIIIDLCEENVELPPSLLQAALKIVREKCEVRHMVSEVRRLAVRLAETGSPEEALALARALPSDREHQRALALVGVAAHWSAAGRSELLAEATEAACRVINPVNDHSLRPALLRSLAAQLETMPLDRMYELWNRTLHSLAAHTRPELLADLGALAPLIARLGGTEAVKESRRTICEVVRVWP